MVATSLFSPSDAFVQVHPFNHRLAEPSYEIDQHMNMNA